MAFRRPLADAWAVLALLVAARTTMAIQFQSVAALGPMLVAQPGFGTGDLGLLIGLYLAPGIALAIPGGAIGARLGDARAVTLGLGLMTLGGLAMAALPAREAQIAGRAVAGLGGVLLNVLMTKMVAERFAGPRLATAMGIFVNSWPLGLAIALVALPPVAALAGTGAAFWSCAGLAAAALLVFARLAPRDAPAPARRPRTGPAAGAWPRGAALGATVLAGAAWGLYNAAIAMVFGFGAVFLGERGAAPAAASATTSIVLWVMVAAVPAGGWLTDRIGRPRAVLAVCFLGFAALLVLATRAGPVEPLLVLVGLAAGLPAGATMSLAGDALGPRTRAVGMGVFFTLFYASVVLAPLLAGRAAERAGTAAVAFDIGAGLLVAALVAALAQARLAVRAGAAPREAPVP